MIVLGGGVFKVSWDLLLEKELPSVSEVSWDLLLEEELPPEEELLLEELIECFLNRLAGSRRGMDSSDDDDSASLRLLLFLSGEDMNWICE